MSRLFVPGTGGLARSHSITWPASDFTIAFWNFNISGAGTVRCLYRDQTGSGNFGAFINSTNALDFFLGGSLVDSTFTPTASVWYHGAVTMTLGSNALCSFFANGSAAGSTTKTPGAVNSALDIGNDAIGTREPGRMADLAMWTTKLSVGEISALANGARPGNIRPASLFRWWPLDGLVSPEVELSGNADTATLFNSPSLAPGPPVAMFTPRWPSFLEPPPPPPGAASMIFSQQTISIPLLMTVPVSVTLHNP